MSRARVRGEFIAGAKGPIFVFLREPLGPTTGCVLVVPPFAEEMNKCRRMVAEVGLELAECGIASVIPDLYGTGDSSGDFAEADLTTWLADLATSVHWSAERGCPVTGMLAIRLGAALAARAMDEGALPGLRKTVLWQPVFEGNRFLTQFLRLRLAANLMADRKETLADLRSALKSGETVEVAGYCLSSRLAAGLDELVCPASLPTGLGDVSWLEIVRDPELPLAAPSLGLIARSRESGGNITATGLPGEPFWASTEIAVNIAMVESTRAHFGGRGQDRDL